MLTTFGVATIAILLTRYTVWAAVTAACAEAVDAYEKDLLVDALKTARGNRSRAAMLLHTTGRVVSQRVKKHGIDCRRFR